MLCCAQVQLGAPPCVQQHALCSLPLGACASLCNRLPVLRSVKSANARLHMSLEASIQVQPTSVQGGVLTRAPLSKHLGLTWRTSQKTLRQQACCRCGPCSTTLVYIGYKDATPA